MGRADRRKAAEKQGRAEDLSPERTAAARHFGRMDTPHRFCVEILLPLARGDGGEVAAGWFASLETRLTDRFGGVTAFTRAPARGRWAEGGQVQTDEVVVLEVMAEELDRAWWARLRAELERDLRQDEVVIRASAIERL
jgi:hypothetical protein